MSALVVNRSGSDFKAIGKTVIGTYLVEERRSPILLTERVDHLEYFAAQLEKLVRHVVVLQGGMGSKERRMVGAPWKHRPRRVDR